MTKADILTNQPRRHFQDGLTVYLCCAGPEAKTEIEARIRNIQQTPYQQPFPNLFRAALR